jgi:signal transduction histidine kinase
VVGEVDRLTQVVNQLLDYAEPEPPGAPEPDLDLAAVLGEVALLYQHEASLTAVEIRTETPVRLPRARGDRAAAREVLGNLIQNAIHAMPGGGVVAVTLEPSDVEILVTIADGGTGVAPGHLERLFAPFFTTKPRGTGLGLAIARHKVEELGGRIEVESPIPGTERPPRATGPGTRFRIAWPVAGAAAGPDAEVTTPTAAERPEG